MRAQIPILTFATEQVTSRLGRLVFEFKRCSKSLDADAVHDLRVAIRRFNQSLRTFRSLLPRGEVRDIRKATRQLMKMAGEIRDRDIALSWLKSAKVSPRSAMWTRLTAQRGVREKPLVDLLKQYRKRDFSSRWRSRLNLDGA
ncbi:MAG: CHAD domain-containing protein [Bryobacteraceae bacterium]